MKDWRIGQLRVNSFGASSVEDEAYLLVSGTAPYPVNLLPSISDPVDLIQDVLESALLREGEKR